MTGMAKLNRKSFLLAATVAGSAALVAVPTVAQAQIGVSVQIAPPLLPVYVQPPMPAEGYLWTPGYWGYQGGAYSWVAGAWLLPPGVGQLWTPPYWGWGGGGYLFHAGYWGPHVGFYGGVNYGFGYGGNGYDGGRWNGGHFAYNSRVNNFGGVHVADRYEGSAGSASASRASFSGGPHGSEAAHTAASAEHHEAIAAPQHVGQYHHPASHMISHAAAHATVHHASYQAHGSVMHRAVASRPAHAAPHGAPAEHHSDRK
jgi:hypothetical protein